MRYFDAIIRFMATIPRTQTVPLILLMFVLAAGCDLIHLREEAETVEDAAVIQGRIINEGNQQGPIVIRKYRLEDGIYVNESGHTAAANGKYRILTLPGSWYLAAFVDINRDGVLQVEQEHANYLATADGVPAPVAVASGKTLTVADIRIRGRVSKPAQNLRTRRQTNRFEDNVGRITDWNATIFREEHYEAGMWRPVSFLHRIGGGLFLLEPYRADKVPVVFVHGINGGPLNWKQTIENLDPRHFQPWLLYYPSGLRLEMIADGLLEALATLHGKYGFKQFGVIAHSMGGLVTRSFVQKCRRSYPALCAGLGLVMTVNSPLGGVDTARLGVQNLPFVVPAWRDLASGSDFLRQLHQWAWPADIPYYLIFSFQSDQGDDGVVNLKSQIPFRLQTEATRVYGFNLDHVGTLTDADFLSVLQNAIERHLQPANPAPASTTPPLR